LKALTPNPQTQNLVGDSARSVGACAGRRCHRWGCRRHRHEAPTEVRCGGGYGGTPTAARQVSGRT